VARFCARCRLIEQGRGQTHGYEGEEAPESDLEAIIGKYQAVKDRLFERRLKVNPSEPDFADYQLRLVSEVIRDLQRVQANTLEIAS
jgi:hypothetical protein